MAEAHERLFFLDVGFSATHRKGYRFGSPPEGEAATDPRYVHPPAPLSDTPETREYMAIYIDAARIIDAQMGRVLAALDQCGLRDDTLVICTTDHGIAFLLVKCPLCDHGIGAMLIVRGPGGFTGGKVSDALVSHIDPFPTICMLAAIEAPEWLQGASLLPLVNGERDAVREEIFVEINYHVCYEPQHAVRTARWKYILSLHDHGRPVLPKCDDSLSKDFMLAHGWREREEAEEWLYDLLYDPYETCNPAVDPACVEVVAALRERLARWRQDTDDPLLREPFFMQPETAQIADPDELSPRDAPARSARTFWGIE